MDRRGWHLDKGVSIAHILTTVALMVSALWYLAGQDKRISNLELNVQHLQQSRLEDQDRTVRKFDELKTDLRTINAKLDRIIEGG
ncbi:hypothetical protein [Marinobacter sp. JSM 1782161]|uniref:hypothetical protein n=1 Tax=Marinobacter sp. JSM 1782161 TaxID=2685906 RepID=UPI0014021CCB|nr:hypothetical protein [Marinobacter sp. JSM 1782161]